jgi:hypothetical protein
MPSGPVVAALVLALAVLVGGVYLFLELRHHAGPRARSRERDGARLPLFGSGGMIERTGEPAAPPRPFPLASYTPPRPAPTASAAPTNGNGHHGAPRATGFEPPLDGTRDTPPARRPIPTPRPALAEAPIGRPGASALADLGAPADAMHDGATLRFAIPDEGTLQFLPGRLEVVSGPDRGREVRFVRSGAGDRMEVTFGRSEGPAYRHVQLMARTVSRQHAAMVLTDGHWALKNLSATNPVLLNGRALEAGEVAPLLVEGDRIEMGEVVFVFHER